MKTEIYVERGNLPSGIVRVLRMFKIGINILRVQASETTTLSISGSDGRRGFVAIVPLDASQTPKVILGSWGGSNMFNPNNVVDLDPKEYDIPPGFAVIKGYEGHTKYAYAIVHPSNFAPLLTGDNDLTDRERWALTVYRSITSSYRKEYFDILKWTQKDIDRMIKLGYLKKYGRGAGITACGHNCCFQESVMAYQLRNLMKEVK